MNSDKEKDYIEKLKKSIMAIKKLKAEVQHLRNMKSEPIAIIGIGCRFPGDSTSPESLWKMLNEGRDGVEEIKDRWDMEAYYDPTPGASGKMYTKHASLIKDVDAFDNLYFGISPREAMYMDPVQRILMEVTYEAIQNAGLDQNKLVDTQTSVYLGFGETSEYGQRHFLSQDPQLIDPYSLTGHMLTAAAGRISYSLGVNGANIGLSTGCSSSLVSTHLACQSLRNGDSDIALAGGANLILSPHAYIALSSMNAVSSDGKCKTFDANADGYGRGEGVGMLVLKRLSDAIRDKDNIWATIKGSAVNQDGQSNGFTAPSGKAQEKVIAEALKNAGLTMFDIDYVEAHGTGTSLGDPIELEALANTYGKTRDKSNPLYVGSIKTNIGHTEGASGVAGIIKSVLALKNEKIPAHLNFKTPNTLINWDDLNIAIPTDATDWKKGEFPRRAGVSAFGISGTNAHVILEEAPTLNSEAEANTAEPEKTCHVLHISAKTTEALNDYIELYIKFLIDAFKSNEYSIQDICAASALRNTHYEQRIAVTGRSFEEFIEKLKSLVELEIEEKDIFSISHKIAFVFPGQGSQWINMGKELMQKEDVFKNTIDACEAEFSKYVSWSLHEELSKNKEESRFNEIDIIQPTLFAIEVALAELWKSKGLVPTSVIGHSMGEVAAAYIAGAITLTDAAKIICTRSRIMKKISGKGAMMATELSYDEAIDLIKGKEDKVSVAVNNSPNSVVLSGDVAEINDFLQQLEKKEKFARLVKVDVASHSPQVEPLKEELLAELGHIDAKDTSIAFYSTVRNKHMKGAELTAEYWADNLRSPVLFYQTVNKMIEEGYTTFIENSPHPILCNSIEQIRNISNKEIFAINSLVRDEPEEMQILQSMGDLHAIGIPVDWTSYYSNQVKAVALPTYPWQRNRFWLELPKQGENSTKPVITFMEEATDTTDKDLDIAALLTSDRALLEKEIAVKKVIKQQIVRLTGVPLSQIKDNIEFKKLGVDSMMAVKLKNKLSEKVQSELSIKTIMQHNSVNKLASYILDSTSDSAFANSTSNSDNWFVTSEPKANAKIKLICFHDAGGNSNLYQKWSKHLHDSIELLCVELPGRGHRMAEPHITEMDQLLDQLTPAIGTQLDKPFIFFGHSMGGTVLFEVTKRIKRQFNMEPLEIIVSAAPSYDGFTRRANPRMSDDDLGNLFSAVKKENFSDEEFFQIVMNTLRADLSILDSYTYQKECILNAPITTILPENDEFVQLDDLEKWNNETKGNFDLIRRPGSHRYIVDDYEFLTSLINEKCMTEIGIL